MLTIDKLGTFNNYRVHLDATVLNEALLGKLRHIKPLNCSVSSSCLQRGTHNNVLKNIAFSRYCLTHLQIHHLSHQNPSKIWLVSFYLCTSSIKHFLHYYLALTFTSNYNHFSVDHKTLFQPMTSTALHAI